MGVTGLAKQAICDPGGRGGVASRMGWVGVLVSPFFITNHHELNGLKQRTFIISVSMDQKSGCGLAGFSAQGFIG